jgi:hypothetical protein
MDTIARPHFTQTGLSRVPRVPRQGTFFCDKRFQAFLDENGPWAILLPLLLGPYLPCGLSLTPLAWS